MLKYIHIDRIQRFALCGFHAASSAGQVAVGPFESIRSVPSYFLFCSVFNALMTNRHNEMMACRIFFVNHKKRNPSKKDLPYVASSENTV